MTQENAIKITLAAKGAAGNAVPLAPGGTASFTPLTATFEGGEDGVEQSKASFTPFVAAEQTVGVIHNWNPGSSATIIEISSDAGGHSSITGLYFGRPATQGEAHIFRNRSAYPFTFSHQDANSAPANQFFAANRSGVNFEIMPGHQFTVIYDEAISKWVIFGPALEALATGFAYPADEIVVFHGSTGQVVKGGGRSVADIEGFIAEKRGLTNNTFDSLNLIERDVQLGDPDSGGPGFRALIVNNDV